MGETVALNILDGSIASDQTAHTARLLANDEHGWEVSWLPGRSMNRNCAITAMLLADLTGPGDMHAGNKLWVHIEGWAAELGLTAQDVLAQIASEPGWTSTGKSALPADPKQLDDPTAPQAVPRHDPRTPVVPPSAAPLESVRQPRMAADTGPQDRPKRDMAFYERLISRGIAEADARGSAIDHVTARRLALWLLPRSQEEPDFMRGLIHFARTGGITNPLKKSLQHHARSPSHPDRPHAARLLQYAVARGTDTGRIGDNFGAICDQIDHADALLEDLHERVGESRLHPERAAGDWRERFTLRPPAMARRDEATQAVTFIIDGRVAEAAVHAITIDAMEREAHIRQVRNDGTYLSEASYGRENRAAIIARETTVVEGLRAIERAYHAALESTPSPEFNRILPPTDRTSDHELEME